MKLIFEYNQANTKHTPEEKDVDVPKELKRENIKCIKSEN